MPPQFARSTRFSPERAAEREKWWMRGAEWGEGGEKTRNLTPLRDAQRVHVLGRHSGDEMSIHNSSRHRTKGTNQCHRRAQGFLELTHAHAVHSFTRLEFGARSGGRPWWGAAACLAATSTVPVPTGSFRTRFPSPKWALGDEVPFGEFLRCPDGDRHPK